MMMTDWCGRRPDGTVRTFRRRRHEPQTVTRAMREQAERRSIERAIENHKRWLACRASTTIIDHWHLEAERQATEAAAAGASLKASVRELCEAERVGNLAALDRCPLRPPLRFPLGKAASC